MYDCTCTHELPDHVCLLHLSVACHAALQCDFIASILGLSKVGWIFTQATKDTPDDYIMGSSEVRRQLQSTPSVYIMGSRLIANLTRSHSAFI